MANSLYPSTFWQSKNDLLAVIWTKLKSHLSSALKTYQYARMMSALSHLSDSQLSEIGVTRTDIPKYAEKLMQSE